MENIELAHKTPAVISFWGVHPVLDRYRTQSGVIRLSTSNFGENRESYRVRLRPSILFCQELSVQTTLNVEKKVGALSFGKEWAIHGSKEPQHYIGTVCRISVVLTSCVGSPD
ncbi:hypothetical protein CBL_01950 [Carabus blaptoides fortunei]